MLLVEQVRDPRTAWPTHIPVRVGMIIRPTGSGAWIPRTGVDGSTAKMPWVVRLEFTPKTGNVVRCAGTVVHKNWILTTQACCQVSE